MKTMIVSRPLPRRRVQRKAPDIRSLFGLTVLGLAAVAIFAAFLLIEPAARPLASEEPRFGERLKFEGVAFGATPETIQARHPSMVLAAEAGGLARGSFQYDGVTYTVWFFEDGDALKAFRMRSDQTHVNVREEDILGDFGRRFGEPIATDCGRRVYSQGGQCRYQWLTRGGVPLDLHLRVRKDTIGNTLTTISILATDAYLDGKRAQSRLADRHARLNGAGF